MLLRFGGLARETGKPGEFEGLLVPFTTPKADDLEFNGVDLYRTYFNRETDYFFDEALMNRVRVFYRHGADEVLGMRLLGGGDIHMREANGDDAAGLWMKAQLALRDEWEQGVMDLVKKKKLALSSGASETMYEVRPVKIGKRDLGYVAKWGLIEGSLTPQPASFGTLALARELTQREFDSLFREAAADTGNSFEAAIANWTPSRWAIEDLLCKMVGQVAIQAKLAATTSTSFDYAKAIQELLDGYSSVMFKHIIKQVADYISGPFDDDGFYLRSYLIEDTDLETHTRTAGGAVLDALRRFRGHREQRQDRGLHAADTRRVIALRAVLQRASGEIDRLLVGGLPGSAGDPGELLTADESARLRSRSLRAGVKF